MKAFREAVVSVDHAGKVIDSLMESCLRCPVPADILRVSGELRPEPTSTCQACGGERYIPGDPEAFYPVARPCPTCNGGAA